MRWQQEYEEMRRSMIYGRKKTRVVAGQRNIILIYYSGIIFDLHLNFFYIITYWLDFERKIKT